MNTHNNKNSPRKLPTFVGCNPRFLTGSLFALFAVLLSPTAALAAGTDPKVSDEDARWFQVELILFSQQTDLALDAEQWPEIEGLQLPEGLLELHLPASEPPKEGKSEPEPTGDAMTREPISLTTDPALEAPAEPDSGMPTAYQVLPEDQLQLTDMAKKLQRSRKHDLLLHIAWQQPTYDRQDAKPVFFIEGMADPLPVEDTENPAEDSQSVSAFDAPSSMPSYATEADSEIGPVDPRFVGTVTLSVERYLHIATDLLYRLPVTQHRPIPIPDLDLWYDRPYPTLHEPQGPAFRQISWQAVRGFQLKESRRMRSTEIHYLDHPFMGMIVVITPVELPEPAEEIQQTSPSNILSTPTQRRTSP